MNAPPGCMRGWRVDRIAADGLCSASPSGAGPGPRPPLTSHEHRTNNREHRTNTSRPGTPRCRARGVAAANSGHARATIQPVLCPANWAEERVQRGVNSRITFGAELRYAMHVRGLSLTDVARLSGVAVATASSAAMGRPVNVTTALRVAHAVAAQPIVPELLEWVERPHPSDLGLDRCQRTTWPAPSGSAAPTTMPANEGIGSRRPRRPEANTPGQLRILAD